MSPPERHRRRPVDSVCIIGAGPSGLAAGKYLSAEGVFSRIVIYEQRDNVGGLWNHVPCPPNVSGSVPIPQTDPYGAERHWAANRDTDRRDVQPVISPVYDQLETNIPRGLMGFSDQEWDHDCQLFPTHETVLQYLERYAADVRHLVQFNTKVLDVRVVADGQWQVLTSEIPSATCSEGMFDAVLVASGHFDVPYIPSVAGIERWNERYPGRITHSKFYRRPQDFADLKTVVVGNSASGSDIATQISTACRLPLLQSQKSTPSSSHNSSPTKVEKPEIVEYISDNRTIRFADGSVESDVDAIVYCTGYFYSFPFFRKLQPQVITAGEYVENLYQHIFYRPNPTLAFVALNQKIIPFPVAEAQSAVIARVWSGRLDLPDPEEMQRWEEETLRQTYGGRNFHVLKFPKDADYINMLHDWAVSFDKPRDRCHELRRRRMSSTVDDNGREAVGSGTVGKEPPFWGEKEYWTRERFPDIKRAFQSFGEERHTKRTLADVGFDFEEWKRERTDEARRLL